MNFIEKHTPKWTSLAGLGRSKIVSATIFMPVIGYFLFFNNQIVEFISLSAELLGLDRELTRNQSFSSLRSLYLGLAFLAVASVAFKLFCPDSIKNTGNISAYVTKYLPLMDPNLHELLKLEVKRAGPCTLVDQNWIQSVIEHQSPLEDPFVTRHPQNNTQLASSQQSYDQWMNKNKVHFNSLLMARFHQDDHSRAWARLFTTASYSIGFLLVLMPSTKIFFAVTAASYADFF